MSTETEHVNSGREKKRIEILSDKRERKKTSGKGNRKGKERKRQRVCKGEIIKKVRKQRRRGVPATKMAVPLAEAAAFN